MIYSFFHKWSYYSQKLLFFILCRTKEFFSFFFLCLLTLTILSLLTGCTKESKPATPVSQSSFALNTIITITLYDGSDPALISECFSLCEGYEREFSRTLPDSTLYRLNNDNSASRSLTPDLYALISLGLRYHSLSGGLFDISIAPLSDLWQFSSSSPTVPDPSAISAAVSNVDASKLSLSDGQLRYDNPSMRLDLGAIAKGYIADRLKEFLLANGVTSALIDLGGNILCIGTKPDGTPFHVGIRKPFSSQGTTLTILAIKDLSVVTSGVYERCFTENGVLYHHLLNPKTGYPFENGLSAVSIISSSSAEGDALSTTCFALGAERGKELIESMPNVYAIFVTDKNELLYTKGAEQFLQ